MSASDSKPAPGSCFKFTVRSADEAVALIRERLGANARVLSVRSIEAKGLRKFISSPKLEVIAQIDGPIDEVSEAAAPRSDERAATNEISSEPALPAMAAESNA